MICVDVGSGYNPKKGYLSCDVNSYCDFNSIFDIDCNSVDKFYIRNTLHHVSDLDSFCRVLSNKAKNGCIVDIIDCNEYFFDTNVFLDKLWYRFIFDRPDIYIREHYVDLVPFFENHGFVIKRKFTRKEKLIITIIYDGLNRKTVRI